MWTAIIGSPVSPEQVLLCMAALKIAREAGQHEPDNGVDAIGYLSMIDEVRYGRPDDGRLAQASQAAEYRATKTVPVPPEEPPARFEDGVVYPPPRAG